MAAIPTFTAITEFTEYAIQTPNWFVDYIQAALNRRDIAGLFRSNDGKRSRLSAIKVDAEHPLVSLTGQLVTKMDVSKIDFAGLLPKVAVVETDDNEDDQMKTLGFGYRNAITINQAYVDNIKASWKQPGERACEGLLTDHQIQLIEAALDRAEAQWGKRQVKGIRQGYFMRENIMVSLWTSSKSDMIILSPLLRSIIFAMRMDLSTVQVRDVQISTAKGLINANFGQILHGQETRLNYLNWFHNITVVEEQNLVDIVDSEGNIKIDCNFLFKTYGDANGIGLVRNPPGEQVIQE